MYINASIDAAPCALSSISVSQCDVLELETEHKPRYFARVPAQRVVDGKCCALS